MSQGDIETYTGLIRCYISRIENGHTIPSVASLEKVAAAFDVPLWKILFESNHPARVVLPGRDLGQSATLSAKDRKSYLKLSRILGRMAEKDPIRSFMQSRGWRGDDPCVVSRESGDRAQVRPVSHLA
jgi:transcriptional regulator with XRE-family HTH domain